MFRSIRIGFAAGLAVLVAAVSHAQTSSELRDDLAELAGEVEAARIEAATAADPEVRELNRQRLAVLELNLEILRNRILLLEGADVEAMQVATAAPDMAEVAAIQSQIAQTESAIKDTEASLAAAEGETRAIIAERLESEKLALAKLRIAYIGARYGAVALIDAEEKDAAVTDETVAEPAEPARRPVETAEPPIWADGRHPGIDYSQPLFQMAYNSGARIAGWWTIKAGRDNDSLIAQNLSQYFPEAALDKRGMLLQMRCVDDGSEITVTMPGRYLAGYDTGSGGIAFDVAYRAGGGVLSRDEWSALSSGDGAALRGAAALDLINDMYSARTLSVELSGPGSGRHTAEFDLTGYYDVEEIARDACAQPVIALNRKDYRLVQTLLNIAGFNAGPADGIWGRNSERAMRNYQAAAGLRASGKPDRVTLQLLGLVE